MAFMPLQQQKLQPRTLTRRFGLTGMTITNCSTDTTFDLPEQQGVTITATLARIEKKIDDTNVRLEKKIDNMNVRLDGLDEKLLVVIIILTAICTLLAFP